MSVSEEPGGGRPLRSQLGSDLWPRIGAAVALGLAALAIAWVGGFVFVAFWWIASVIVLWEWQRMVQRDRLIERVGVGAFALAVAALFAMHDYALGAMAALILGGAAVGWVAGPAARIQAGGGALYAGALVVSLGLLRASPSYGLPAILWLFAVVWGTDVAAYFAGRLIGGPRLGPACPRARPGPERWRARLRGRRSVFSFFVGQTGSAGCSGSGLQPRSCPSSAICSNPG